MNSSSILILKQSAKLSQLFNQFNDTTENHTNKDTRNAVKWRYYDIEEIQNLKIPNKGKSLYTFRINACSLSKTFDDVKYLLNKTNMRFDIIEISETRINKNTNKISSIKLTIPLNSPILNPQQEEIYSLLHIIWFINQELTFKFTKTGLGICFNWDN